MVEVMHFNKLIFENYKTFYGTQELTLTPPLNDDCNKNILLVGGLNGAGKTTILKAILYALFGKRGFSQDEHKRVFSNVINNTFFNEGGRKCSITLVIETDSNEIWKLIVTWHFSKNKSLSLEEREIHVTKANGSIPKVVKLPDMAAFNKQIDRIIPYHAAPFFIFDGEEIKELILRQDSEEMKNAIKKITGMESYDQLVKDLDELKDVYLKQLAKASNAEDYKAEYKKLEKLKEEQIDLDKRIKRLEHLKTDVLEKLDLLKTKRAEKLRNNNNSKSKLATKLGGLEVKKATLTDEFRTFFNENALNIIMRKQISKLQKQIKLEQEFKKKQILREQSLSPYHEFINQLLNKDIDPPLSNSQLKQLKNLGEEIWAKEHNLDRHADEKILHDLNSKDFNMLNNIMVKDPHHLAKLLKDINYYTEEIIKIENILTNAPEEEDITQENNQIDVYTKKAGEYEAKYRAVYKKRRSVLDDISSLRNKVTRANNSNIDTDQIKKEIDLLNRTTDALRLYIKRITNFKANFIKESFKEILLDIFRKNDEFGKIEFDVNDYSIKLYNDKLQEVSIRDRSAGEMQMISSALIWALTKVSDLDLPIIVDTPLGRLDSEHRNRLINHYYKNLSHQVIILSTDTEISKDYINTMKDHSYKQYMLDYDENKKYTIIRDGYFEFN